MTLHEATVHTATTYLVSLIYDSHLVWLTHKKLVADQHGVLVFIDSCSNEITVPQATVWIEGKRSKQWTSEAAVSVCSVSGTNKEFALRFGRIS
jgi:hypothetical protein